MVVEVRKALIPLGVVVVEGVTLCSKFNSRTNIRSMYKDMR